MNQVHFAWYDSTDCILIKLIHELTDTRAWLICTRAAWFAPDVMCMLSLESPVLLLPMILKVSASATTSSLSHTLDIQTTHKQYNRLDGFGIHVFVYSITVEYVQSVTYVIIIILPMNSMAMANGLGLSMSFSLSPLPPLFLPLPHF